MSFIYEIINPEKGEALAEVKKSHIEQLPIYVLDLSKKSDKLKHDNIVSLVNRMLELKKKEAAEQNPQARLVITRQIDGVDKAIDEAVCELYGVGEEEICVEGET